MGGGSSAKMKTPSAKIFQLKKAVCKNFHLEKSHLEKFSLQFTESSYNRI